MKNNFFPGHWLGNGWIHLISNSGSASAWVTYSCRLLLLAHESFHEKFSLLEVILLHGQQDGPSQNIIISPISNSYPRFHSIIESDEHTTTKLVPTNIQLMLQSSTSAMLTTIGSSFMQVASSFFFMNHWSCKFKKKLAQYSIRKPHQDLMQQILIGHRRCLLSMLVST